MEAYRRFIREENTNPSRGYEGSVKAKMVREDDLAEVHCATLLASAERLN